MKNKLKGALMGSSAKVLSEDLPAGHKDVQAIINLLPLSLSSSHSPHSPSTLPLVTLCPHHLLCLPLVALFLSLFLSISFCISQASYFTHLTHIVTTVFSPSLSSLTLPPPPLSLSLSFSPAWSYQYSSLNISLNGSLVLDAIVCCS